MQDKILVNKISKNDNLTLFDREIRYRGSITQDHMKLDLNVDFFSLIFWDRESESRNHGLFLICFKEFIR